MKHYSTYLDLHHLGIELFWISLPPNYKYFHWHAHLFFDVRKWGWSSPQYTIFATKNSTTSSKKLPCLRDLSGNMIPIKSLALCLLRLREMAFLTANIPPTWHELNYEKVVAAYLTPGHWGFITMPLFHSCISYSFNIWQIIASWFQDDSQ